MPDDKKKEPAGVRSQAPATGAKVDTLTKIVDRINSSDSILVALSDTPSVDELAAAIGLTMLLDRINKHATAIFSGQIPNTLEFLKPEETLEKNTDSLRDFIIALNKAKADHIRYMIEGDFVRIYITPYRTTLDKKDLEFSYGDYNVDLVISLNVKNSEDLDDALSEHGRIMHDAVTINIANGAPGRFAELEWSMPEASSVCEMVITLAERLEVTDFEQDIATALLTGIVSATERFSNSRTTPGALTLASKLMSAGADQQLISSNIMKKKSDGTGLKTEGNVGLEVKKDGEKGEEKKDKEDKNKEDKEKVEGEKVEGEKVEGEIELKGEGGVATTKPEILVETSVEDKPQEDLIPTPASVELPQSDTPLIPAPIEQIVSDTQSVVSPTPTTPEQPIAPLVTTTPVQLEVPPVPITPVQSEVSPIPVTPVQPEISAVPVAPVQPPVSPVPVSPAPPVVPPVPTTPASVNPVPPVVPPIPVAPVQPPVSPVPVSPAPPVVPPVVSPTPSAPVTMPAAEPIQPGVNPAAQMAPGLPTPDIISLPQMSYGQPEVPAQPLDQQIKPVTEPATPPDYEALIEAALAEPGWGQPAAEPAPEPPLPPLPMPPAPQAFPDQSVPVGPAPMAPMATSPVAPAAPNVPAAPVVPDIPGAPTAPAMDNPPIAPTMNNVPTTPTMPNGFGVPTSTSMEPVPPTMPEVPVVPTVEPMPSVPPTPTSDSAFQIPNLQG